MARFPTRAVSWLSALASLCAGTGRAHADDPSPAAPGSPAPVAAARGYLALELTPAAILPEADRARFVPRPADADVLVSHLVPDGPAHRAGLRYGDVVVRYAGREVPPFEKTVDRGDNGALWEAIDSFAEAFASIGESVRAGEEVEVVRRAGRTTETVRVKAVDRAAFDALVAAGAEKMHPQPPTRPAGEEASPPARGFVGLGLAPAPFLSPAQRARTAATPAQGVLVVTLTPGLPAERAGLKVGERVLRYAGRPAPDAGQFEAADADARVKWQEAFRALVGTVKPGDAVEVVVERDGKEVAVRLQAVDRTAMDRATYVAGSRNRY